MRTNRPHSGSGYEGSGFNNVLQNCLVCAQLTVDGEGKVIAMTPEAENVLRLPAGQPRPLGLEALPAPLQAVIREVQATGQIVVDRQVVVRTSGGVPLAVSVTALTCAPAGPGRGVAVMLKDVSSTVKLEHHLRRLDRLASFGTLSASMAHEIKNALVPVRTFVELLLEKHPDAELSETVRREMARVDTIVSRMLKFTAPAKPEFSTVRLHDILEHSLRLVQHRVEDKSIAFDRQFGAAADLLSGDDHQLEQAFVNLLLNAVEAIGVEGTLTVSTEAIPDETPPQLREEGAGAVQLRVKISDTGTGIAPENMASIFEPFFTTKLSGTGLGLPVTRRIIEEHNGAIHVESRPGQGTTFTLLLPASVAAPRPA